MAEKIKVSVIVPVYQVERYLAACVDSILAQSYPHFEVILVDDGSTDGSPAICDAYAAQDARVIVVHQRNGGLSDARNTGIRRASGDYVLFLDGDDFYHDPDALKKLTDRAAISDADVIQFSYEKYCEETAARESYLKAEHDMPLKLDKAQQLSFLFSNGLYIASACNKMIRRSLFEEGLFFEKGIYSEDVDWCARLLLKAESMDYIAEQLYSYRQHGSSIRHTINDKKCSDLKSNILKCIELAQLADDAEKQALLAYSAFQYGTFFMVQAQAERVQKDCMAQLAPHQGILKYHHGNKKLLCLHLSCSVLGYQTTCMLIRKLIGRKRG